jgi:hypothetical protein
MKSHKQIMVLLCIFAATVMQSHGFYLESSVVGGGQYSASSANYRHMGTAWQTASTLLNGLNGTNYKADIGYWQPWNIGHFLYVEEDKHEDIKPLTFALMPNYPNPVKSMTTIKYSLPEETEVCLKIFNIMGQQVNTFRQGKQPAGQHQIHWNCRDERGQRVSAGVYIYRLEAGVVSDTKKMVVIR